MHVKDYKPLTVGLPSWMNEQLAREAEANNMLYVPLTPQQETTVEKHFAPERTDVTDMVVGDTNADMVKGFLNQLAQLPWKEQNEILKTIASHVETARAATVKNLELQLQQAKKYRKPLFRRIF